MQHGLTCALQTSGGSHKREGYVHYYLAQHAGIGAETLDYKKTCQCWFVSV